MIERERGRGVGKALSDVMIKIAKKLGYQQLIFYTSNLNNVPMYMKMGATILCSRPFHGHDISVMKYDLSKHA